MFRSFMAPPSWHRADAAADPPAASFATGDMRPGDHPGIGWDAKSRGVPGAGPGRAEVAKLNN